jgi:Flp pilus assembly protein TadD
MRFARLAVLAVGILACAWFGLGIRQAHEINAAKAIISQKSLSSAEAKRAAAHLDSADTLNPDREVAVLRGALAVAEGNNPLARRVLLPVIRQEPKNLEAWLAYARATGDEPQTFLAVRRAISRFVREFPARH